jgi:serine/threonine protein kinase
MINELLNTIENEEKEQENEIEESKSLDYDFFNMSGFVLNYENNKPVIEEDCERLNKYELKEVLGEGAFGSVNLLCYKNNCNYVLKVQKNNDIFLDEVQAHYELQHTNCVPKIFDAWSCNDKGYFVIELLSSKINLENKEFLKQLNKCVKTLHNNNWTHNDLKEDNLLFNNKTGNLVLSDLGMATKKTDNLDKTYDKLEGIFDDDVTWLKSKNNDMTEIQNIMIPKINGGMKSIKKYRNNKNKRHVNKLKTKKHKKTKRNSNKRKKTKRNSNKRKTNKRNSNKRNSNKRNSNKRNKTKRNSK